MENAVIDVRRHVHRSIPARAQIVRGLLILRIGERDRRLPRDTRRTIEESRVAIDAVEAVAHHFHGTKAAGDPGSEVGSERLGAHARVHGPTDTRALLPHGGKAIFVAHRETADVHQAIALRRQGVEVDLELRRRLVAA